MIGVPKPIRITRPRVGIKRKPKPAEMRVTPQVAEEVFARDLRISGGCVAPKIDPLAGECRDRFGNYVRPYARAALTLDHVRDHSMMGKTAPSDRRHLVAICWGHHVLTPWATSHRPELRRYLLENERG